MSISTRPPSPPSAKKKRGPGCLGCGCIVLFLIAGLSVALIGAALYGGYETIIGMTTTTAPSLPVFNGTDDMYMSARQKLADFDHDVQNHQAATIQLSADELNALIARNPDAAKNNLHAFISMTDDEGRIQASAPTDIVSHGTMPGRYFTFDVTFEVHFDAPTKSLNVVPHSFQAGDKVLFGANADASDSSTLSPASQTYLRTLLNQTLNTAIRNNPDGAALLDEAKSIEIQNGQLVIQTQ